MKRQISLTALRRLHAIKAAQARSPHLLATPARRINERGLTLVKHFEGLYLKAYRDEVGILTIGWGFTGYKHRDGTVYPGMVITREKAEEFLKWDMRQFETRVLRFTRVPLTDDQFSALVSFDFNVGAIDKSTLGRLLNAKDYEGASNQFGRWVKAGGRTLRGLVRRRASERNLFLGRTPYIVE